MDQYGQHFIIQGPVIHSISKDEIAMYENATIEVKHRKIFSFDPEGKVEEGKENLVHKLGKGQFLCPGFIDLHIHAPQYPNIGIGLELPLLDWLTTYTFPLESKYSDVDFATKVYNYAVKSSLSCGTTTAVYYGTIHSQSTIKLGQIVSDLGQRAIIGKVNMNRNSPIESYVETTENSITSTQEVVDGIKKIKGLFHDPLVEAAVTPRFAITCDMDLLKALAKLAKEQDLYIQTHISENKKEVEAVKELFPECCDYTDVYDKAGLLTKKTILAHAIYLSEREMNAIKFRGTSIAHCPNSNTSLQSGLCDVRRLWQYGIKVGLGTDVSGGNNPSILDAMRCAMTTSIHLSFQSNNYKPLNYQEAFYLATLGGAAALGKENKIGNFAEEKDFDAILVDMNMMDGTAGVFPHHSLKELVQKFIYCGDNTNISKVFVRGKLVFSNQKTQT